MIPQQPADDLARLVKARAAELGFALCGIAPAVRPAGADWLRDWIAAGMAGEMHYIPRREAAYSDPNHVLDNVRSIIMVAENYRQPPQSEQLLPGQGRVAAYARGPVDYHDVLRDKLKSLAEVLHEHRPQSRTRIVVDTAPLLERDFAKLAGLGWFGKNTMLINKRQGSYFFLAALLTDVELPPDAPHETTHCGTCTRCLDACPTQAFPQAYVLDARRCISYLTIELRNSPIPLDLRQGMGDWLFGCDICQDVCPWNRKAPLASSLDWQAHGELHPLDATQLLAMCDEEFDRRFGDTPLARTGRAALVRNAAIVLGNSGQPAHIPALQRSLNDPSELVSEACQWAITQLSSRLPKE